MSLEFPRNSAEFQLRPLHPPSLWRVRNSESSSMGISSLGSGDLENSCDSVFEVDSGSCAMKASSCKSTPQIARRPRFASLNRSCESTDSSTGSSRSGSVLTEAKTSYRIMVLGDTRVGKTSIIRQFLYDNFSKAYQTTMDDMYRGEFDIQGKSISFDIQDVSGSYVYEFPAMMNVSLASADAFIIVFSLDDNKSWEEVNKLRDLVHQHKDPDVPIVVVGNKTDLPFNCDLCHETLEATVIFDWENGYVECSAKDRININKIFKELLQQAKSRFDFSMAGGADCPIGQSKSRKSSTKCTFDDVMRRRQSLPAVPAGMDSDTFNSSPVRAKRETKSFKVKRPRRSSLAALRRDSCKLS